MIHSFFALPSDQIGCVNAWQTGDPNHLEHLLPRLLRPSSAAIVGESASTASGSAPATTQLSSAAATALRTSNPEGDSTESEIGGAAADLERTCVVITIDLSRLHQCARSLARWLRAVEAMMANATRSLSAAQLASMKKNGACKDATDLLDQRVCV